MRLIDLTPPRPFALLALVALAGLIGCNEATGPTGRPPGPGTNDEWLWSGAGDEILYLSPFSESGERSILGLNPSTGVVRTVVASAAEWKIIDHLARSRDGQYLYFLAGASLPDSARSRTANLYRVRVQNPSIPQLLVPDIELDRWSGPAAISPDGDMVATSTTAGRVTLVRGASGERTTLVDQATDGAPSFMLWSPDGQTLLFLSGARFSAYHVATSQWTFWDAPQRPTPPTYLGYSAARWEGDNPSLYGIRFRHIHDRADASALRYDVGAGAQQELGAIHGELTDYPSNYSWSPDLTMVAWSRSWCTQTATIIDSPVCMASTYELRVTKLATGVTTTVASLSIDDWPKQGGGTAFSPNGTRIAFAAGPLGMRVFAAP